MPTSLCCQYAVVLLPSKLNLGFAGVVRVAFASDISHAVLSMLLAICRRLAALDIVVRSPFAGTMGAKPVEHVYHSVSGMLLAVCRLLAALDVEVRRLSARVM